MSDWSKQRLSTRDKKLKAALVMPEDLVAADMLTDFRDSNMASLISAINTHKPGSKQRDILEQEYARLIGNNKLLQSLGITQENAATAAENIDNRRMRRETGVTEVNIPTTSVIQTAAPIQIQVKSNSPLDQVKDFISNIWSSK